MASVTVTPETFTMVRFDAGRIRAIAEQLAAELGLGAGEDIHIEVDERTPLGRSRLVSWDPVVLHVEGGAFEDPTNPRELSERGVADTLGRMLLRARDRRSEGFAAAPAEDDLDLAQSTAWAVYGMGRLERLGHDARKPRWRYHFRNRHGFTDVADAVFDRLWTAEGLTWADLDAACRETAAARQPATA